MLNLPSFVKLAKYKRFEYKPRYYDPIKEEIEARKRQLAQENIPLSSAGENIRAAFQKKRKIGSRRTDFGQIIMILGFMATFWIYFEFGNVAWIALLFFMAAYIWYKRKNS